MGRWVLRTRKYTATSVDEVNGNLTEAALSKIDHISQDALDGLSMCLIMAAESGEGRGIVVMIFTHRG